MGWDLPYALYALISTIIIKMCKAKGHSMKVTTPISKEDISLLGFAFVNNDELVSDVNDIHRTGTTMIARFQALMTCWNGGIWATGGLIAPEKTQWFFTAFFWDGLDWAYHERPRS